MNQRDERALCALEQKLQQPVHNVQRSYYVNGERHTGPHQRYYYRWLHELKKQ
jgi:hypothetical protein